MTFHPSARGSEPSCDRAQPPADGDDGQQNALSSTALLQGHASIAIDHLGTRYVLRATRAGKLILTK